jgi:hypothetical protein
MPYFITGPSGIKVKKYPYPILQLLQWSQVAVGLEGKPRFETTGEIQIDQRFPVFLLFRLSAGFDNIDGGLS